MIKSKKRRLLAAAFGGALMIAGAAAPAAAADFRAMLNGDNLLPAGDSDGWGRANIDIDDAFDRLCVDLEVRSVADVTSVQLLRGKPGEGSPVLNLDTPDDDNDEDDCDRIGDTLADEIRANPGEFYVEVKTAEHPHGAIRGQLVPSAS
ncbi:CHRD domain-containing protein [Sphingosinicella sp. CPCC 101087]|uniref:CHRD domain-containing protein n=1 Tax=Sphingosinicella sp. CPCC 101087 TaxID=2497754 RepID=UPI00101C2DF4|nr:CHRD domain-containing protein [Sphingosinicella sp. CPCC 101087]